VTDFIVIFRQEFILQKDEGAVLLE